jgi:hypothetical protein
MSDYGKHFIAVVDPTAAESPLHWSVRPFWHHLSVQLHDDGISVIARDDLPRTAPSLPRPRAATNGRVATGGSPPQREQTHEPARAEGLPRARDWARGAKTHA